MYKRFFKIPEAVVYSGHSRSALYQAAKDGALVLTKFGGSTLIDKSDLDAFLDATGVKSQAIGRNTQSKDGACADD